VPLTDQRDAGGDGVSLGVEHARALVVEAARTGFDVLEDQLATVDIVADRQLRGKLLHLATERGQVDAVVTILARFLPASTEADPSVGRWLVPDPADVAADLWEASGGSTQSDLIEHTVFLARYAPHKVSGRLAHLAGPRLGGQGWPNAIQVESGRRRHRQMLTDAAADLAGQLHVPGWVGWVDDVILTLLANESADDYWVASIVAGADCASVQRVAARLAWRGQVGLLARLLSTPAALYDLDLLAARVADLDGSAAFEQLLTRVEHGVSAGTVTVRRLHHLLEGVAAHSNLDAEFWARRPVPALRSEPLENHLYSTLTDRCAGEAADVAVQLAPLWEGTVAGLAECAHNLLTRRATTWPAGTVTA
jgi:hypothetical protein